MALTERVAIVHLGEEVGRVEFVDSYRPVVSYSLAYDEHKQILLGERNPRYCTLCGRTSPAVKFKSVAHVLPEALGNKCLKTREECDECNYTYGQSQDNELASFLRPELSLARVPGKAGPKKYSLGHGRSSLGGTTRAEPVSLEIREDDSSFVVDYTEHGFKITTPGVSFAPLGAMKSIARSTWHVLGRERQARYPELRRWLISEIESGPISFYHSFVPGPGMPRLGFIVWESRDPLASLPIVAMVHTGHSLLMLFIPSDLRLGNQGVTALPPLPQTIPPLKILKITAANSGRVNMRNSTIDTWIGGDSFPQSVGQILPVILSTETASWKAVLSVSRRN